MGVYLSKQEADRSVPLQQRIRALVVEDSLVAMQAVSNLLGTHPAIELAGVARNGEQGLKMAELLQPDLVLTDMEMPDMGGLQLTEILRKKYPAMRLVVVSTHEHSLWQQLSRACGADAFVNKHRLSIELEPLIGQLFPVVSPLDTADATA